MPTSEVTRSGGDAPPGAGVVPDDPAQFGRAMADYATWPQRVAAAIFDNAILGGVTWLALGMGFAQPPLTPTFTPGGDVWPGNPLILVPIAVAVVLLVLQGTTGWTPGKLVVGIRVVSERSQGPAGVGTVLARWVLHLLDAVLLIGYLRPLWHQKGQTFADGIVRTVVVPAVPELPRRPRIVLYLAALVIVVLGLGYGCVPFHSGAASTLMGGTACMVDGNGPALKGGEIRPGGSAFVERDRRLWTVREAVTIRPGATLSWRSEPEARDVRYRVELDARPVSGDRATVSRSWDVDVDETQDWSDSDDPDELWYSRQVSPFGDVHDAEVEIGESGAFEELGTDLMVRVRLIADGQPLAECETSVTYTG
jgi:Mce-associated membrane protein